MIYIDIYFGKSNRAGKSVTPSNEIDQVGISVITLDRLGINTKRAIEFVPVGVLGSLFIINEDRQVPLMEYCALTNDLLQSIYVHLRLNESVISSKRQVKWSLT